MCGARLAAPKTDGSAATTAGSEGAEVTLDAESGDENVIYLPQPSGGELAPNVRAQDYDGVDVPVGANQDPADPAAPASPDMPTAHPAYAAELAKEIQSELAASPDQALPPSLSTAGSHGVDVAPEDLRPPVPVDDNPFGNFFADGPTAWLDNGYSDEDDDEDSVEITKPRLIGGTIALLAITFTLVAWGWWARGLYYGAGGAEAGGFILIALLLWIRYLTLDRMQQHAFLLRRYRSFSSFIDRKVLPIQQRTEESLAVRRERDRYRAMNDERQRRIAALGEGAYRSFRAGTLPHELQQHAQRVMVIERQMIVQDQRIHQIITKNEPEPNDHLGQ